MTNTQNENIILHAGRPWSEETKQRVREARKAGVSVYELFASHYRNLKKLRNPTDKQKRGFVTQRVARINTLQKKYEKNVSAKKTLEAVKPSPKKNQAKPVKKQEKVSDEKVSNSGDKRSSGSARSSSGGASSKSQASAKGRAVKVQRPVQRTAQKNTASPTTRQPKQNVVVKQPTPEIKATIEIRKLERLYGRRLTENERGRIKKQYGAL